MSYQFTRFGAVLLAAFGLIPQLLAQSPHKSSAANSQNDPGGGSHLLSGATKAIVVITGDWNKVDGTAVRYVRRGGAWRPFGQPVPVVVGKNGMAWDPEIIPERQPMFPGPVKHEGDGRAPAGVFKLTSTFGFGHHLSDPREYISLTPTIECVDDPDSRHYGQIVDRSSVKDVDWKSSEKMSTVNLYRLGMVVSYNMEQSVPGNGSCIFLHIWQGPGQGTAGCTATTLQNIEGIVRWIGEKDRAVLVQLPAAEYKRLKAPWRLP
jgi:D-alanyl-D-alanine dipeptidase